MKYLLYNNTIEPLKYIKLRPKGFGTQIQHVSGSSTVINVPFPIVTQIAKEASMLKINCLDLRV